jgi:hypothetical protein
MVKQYENLKTKTMIKNTKWTFVKNTSDSDTKVPTYLVLENKRYNAQNIATVIPCYGLTAEQVEANARLIAAAPELLAALKELTDNPRRVLKASAAYDISKKLPLPDRLKDDAEWYGEIMAALEIATLDARHS